MLILIAHGSPRAAWRESVEKLIESLQQDLGRDAVRLAYMERTPPTLMDAATDAVREGATSIRVLPLFLAGEGHVERNIRPLVDEVDLAFPEIDVELLPAAGQHPLFREMLRGIALEDLK
jgi:sirohydrochlorin cobaltochelatase